MGHATTQNETPFAFETFFLLDELGRPLVVPLLKATYDLAPGAPPALAEQQEPIHPAGTRWSDADDASYRTEPECSAFFKPATDVALVGHAGAPRRGATQSVVSLRVGLLHKTVRVFGDRFWVQSQGVVRSTAPQPFERIPLAYEHAFGGWDRSDPDPQRHAYEPRNPVGVGFRAPGARFVETPLPNLEDPGAPLSTYAQSPAPPPAGVGFLLPGWHPRSQLAGTYDARWEEDRMPLLPADFDRRFFNAASPGLVSEGHLSGNEEVAIEGTWPHPSLVFSLPSVRPTCRVGIRRAADADVTLHLDTVVFDTDRSRLTLLWRGHHALPDSAHDLQWIALMDRARPSAARRS